MDKYFNLLAQQEYLKHVIREKKAELHKKHFDLRKFWYRVLDVLVICIILFNFGAVLLTNAMVVKTEPNVELYEVNIVAASMNDYEPHPEWKSILTATMKQFLIWMAMIYGYIYLRRTVMTDAGLAGLGSGVVYLFSVLGWDFFNDLGFLVGSLL